MPFTPKDWRDSPGDLTTPITAAALEDMESRVTAGIAYENVKWHGAVGDNTTDDTAAIQAALNASGAGVVFLPTPAVAYKVTTTLTVPAGVILRGAGRYKSIVNVSGTPGATNGAIRLNGIGAGIEDVGLNIISGAYLRGVRHDASRTRCVNNRINVTSSSSGNGYAVFCAVTDTDLVDCETSGNEILASGVGGPFMGIHGTRAPGWQINNNWIHDFASITGQTHHQWAIYTGDQCDGSTIMGNEIHDIVGSGIHIYGDDGTFSGTGGGPEADYGRTVIGNVIHTVSKVAIGVSFCNGAIVADNQISGCVIGVSAESSQVMVRGNHFESKITDGAVGGTSFISLYLSPASIVADNYFGTRGTAAECIYIEGSSDSLVAGNTCQQTDRPGTFVFADTTTDRLLVTGNVIPTTDSADGNNVMEIAGDDVVVSDNLITGQSGINVVNVTGARAVIRGNRILGGVRGVRATGADARIFGNYITGFSTASVLASGTTPLVGTSAKGTGTIASGSTAATITHGCPFTPDPANISITPTATTTTDPGNIWVSTIGATTFAVNCRTNPGASGMAFAWQVVVASG